MRVKTLLLFLCGLSFFLYVKSPDSILVDFSKYILIAFCAAMWVVVNKLLYYILQKTSLFLMPTLLGIFSDVAAAGMIIYWILGGCTTVESKGMYLVLALSCGLAVLLYEQENVKEEEYEKD